MQTRHWWWGWLTYRTYGDYMGAVVGSEECEEYYRKCLPLSTVVKEWEVVL